MIIPLNINERVRKSDMGKYAYYLSAATEKWIKEQRLLMDEEEYLAYLCAIKGWLEGGS
jgi:hypothetical protein